MVKVSLDISATLENVDILNTCHPNYSFFLKLRCTNCGESTDKWHDITESERVQQSSRTPDGFNFFIKCKMCSRENTIDIIQDTNASYTIDDSEKFKAIVIFDCRGVEPYDFSPRSGWIIKASQNGMTFNDVDLSEDDWVEYDQKNNQTVGIYEFKSQFTKIRK